MPDFVAKQLVNRGIGYAGTNRFQNIDKLIVAVSYSTEKGEQYQVLAVNGQKITAEKGNNYAGLEGSSTTGEFTSTLKNIFDKESKTEFKFLDTNILRNRSTFLFEYKIALENNKIGSIAYIFSKHTYEDTNAGQKGKIWIDKETNRILRIEYEATELKKDFPIKAFTKIIEYDLVKIADEQYLLPSYSEARFTSRQNSELIQDRNQIRFKEYQKFGTEIKILDEDVVEGENQQKP
jgi:hypothetical protein